MSKWNKQSIGARKGALAAFICGAAILAATHDVAAQGAPLYQNDFSKAEVGKLPEEMMLMDGGFAVQELNGNKVLQLPGAPLDTYSVLFGPSKSADVSVKARVHSSKKGRREPAFAVGLNGNSGYRLQVSGAKKLLELYKGDEVLAKAPFTLESDTWTVLKLQVRTVKPGEYAIEGKTWKEGTTEPTQWLVTAAEKTEGGKELGPGRASIWGNPFAGTPITYDDVVVEAIK